MSHDAFPFLETIRAAMVRDDKDAGPWPVQPVRPGDTLDWLPMRGEDRGGDGGPAGG